MLGYIGFFDILGYKSFLKHNTDNTVQDDVLKFISQAESPSPDQNKKLFPRVVGKSDEDIVRNIWNKINWMVFSDTIVFTSEPYDPELQIQSLIILRIAQDLMKRMFDFGLPLRGAIHYGNYKVAGHNMAGRGIVEAYEYGRKVNLSSCVASKKLMERLGEFSSHEEEFAKFKDNIIILYNTPMTDGHREDHYNLVLDGLLTGNDIRDYVHRKFWSHNKDLSDERSVQKVEETERFIRFCLMRENKWNKMSGVNGDVESGKGRGDEDGIEGWGTEVMGWGTELRS